MRLTRKDTSRLRLATPDDAAGCLMIYGPIVLGTSISFETEVPSETEFGARIELVTQSYPWILAEDATGSTAGYAYASLHRARKAYQWSVETSAYVHPHAHRSGLGRRMYEALFDCLRAQGIHNCYAGVTLPNPPSEAFHAALGFEVLGTYDRIGCKNGVWHSVRWSQKRLMETEGEPPPPRLLPDCREEIEAILARR